MVVGSLAYDHVMQYDGVFEDSIVPGNFNMSFTVSSRALFYGGCAGNIAYTLRLFDEHPVIMTVVGGDFEKYEQRLIENGVDVSAVYKSDRHLTASAFIATDKEQNQLTVFDPGAMLASLKYQIADKVSHGTVSRAIIAPDTPDRMTTLADECRSLGIPYIFDPGQQLGVYENDALLVTAKHADILIVNEYESGLMSKKLDISRERLAGMTPVFIETHGANGSYIKETFLGSAGEETREHHVNAVTADHVIDPTGCGDAFRAGILAGLNRGYDIAKSARIGSLSATYSIEQFGTQGHFFTHDEFAYRFQKCFGEEF